MSDDIKKVDLRPSTATSDDAPKLPKSAVPSTAITAAAVPAPIPAAIIQQPQIDGFENEGWVYPSSNDKGQGVPITLRLPPDQMRLISEAVATRRFPYDDKAHLCRHAVFYHLDRLSRSKNFGHESLHAQVMAIHRIMEEHEHNQAFLDVISRMEKYVYAAIQRNDKQAAREMVQSVRRQVNLMQPESWRKRYQGEINRKLAPLLDGIYQVDAEVVK